MEICVCSICKTEISWDGADDNKGIIWSCEKCGEFFCEQCFKNKHGEKVYYSMVSDAETTDNENDEILCPKCYV